MANKIKSKQEQIAELQKQIKEEKMKVETKIGKHFLHTFQLHYEDEKEVLTLIHSLHEKYQKENEETHHHVESAASSEE